MPFEPPDYEPAGYEPADFEPWLPVDLGGISTTLTIAGVDYDGPAWAEAGILGLAFSWDLESPWSLTFSVLRICNGMLPFVPGVEVRLSIDYGDGMGPRLRFVGDLDRPEGGVVAEGYQWNYTCTDLKWRADRVTLTALDGSGTTSFNLPGDDFSFYFAVNGRTVGQILTALLQEATNAASLDAAGVGAYVSLSPPTLPADTLTDLAALNVVPPEAVRLSGESLLNLLEQFLQRWHPQYALWVEATGIIRIRSIFTLPAVPVALPAADGTGADVDWPTVNVDCTDCYSSWSIRGLDIQTAYLSVHDGTLSEAWTGTLESSWTINDFLQPKDGADDGAASGVTSTSCTVHSDHATAHWVTNFWSGGDQAGWIYLYNPAGAGLELYEMRPAISCTSLSPGGSATVNWDPSLPLSSTGYTRYRLIGLATPKALVGRDFHVREPSTGKVDRDTIVGARMVPRSPKGMPIANLSRAFNVFYPYAYVQWSQTGAYPWFEVPINVQLDPIRGHIVLTEPAVIKSAGLAGTSAVLKQKYPTTFAEGLFYDLKVLVPYNRGSLDARAPASGEAGTAHTTYGISRTKLEHRDDFNWVGDSTSLALLAAERLACVKDAVVEGNIAWHELPGDFDPFVPGFSLSISASGSSTPLDGLSLPVRTCVIRWHDEGPSLHTVSMRFSNLKRPFQGDTLYTHPALSQGGAWANSDDVWAAAPIGREVYDTSGNVVGFEGSANGDDYNLLAAESGQVSASDLPTNQGGNLGPGGSADPLGDIVANNDAIGSELGGQADADVFGDHARQFDAAQEAANAPFAEELGRQSRAAESGDPFGVLEGYRPGQPNRQANREARASRNAGRPDPSAGTPIDPDAGEPPPPPPPPPPRPGGLAERRGRRDDLDDTIGGGG